MAAPDSFVERPPAPQLLGDTEEYLLKGGALDTVFSEDTDHFWRRTVRAGAMVSFDSPSKFVALGASHDRFSQNGWSADVNSLVLTARDTNQRTAEGFNGRLALASGDVGLKLYGEANWNIRFNERTGVDLILNRDVVEASGAFKEHIFSNFAAINLDHAVTDRLTVIAMPTYRWFSDDNTQQGARGWLIYSLFPEYGVSAEIKGQVYSSDGDSLGLYFHPDHYERYEGGLRWRGSFRDWRVLARVDFGEETINHDIRNPTRILSLSMQKNFANDVTAGLQIAAYQAAGMGTDINASADYEWRMARFYLAVPF